MARTCREPGCGRSIIFVETEAGQKMPVDAEPDPTGNVWLPAVAKSVAIVVGKDDHARRFKLATAGGGGSWHRPHFDSCSNPDGYRRRGRR